VRRFLRGRTCEDWPIHGADVPPSYVWARQLARRVERARGVFPEQALELMLFLSAFNEAMLGVVQRAGSEPDADFDAYAEERFERLEPTVASPAFVAALGDG